MRFVTIRHPSEESESLMASRVRQWLRERSGTALCSGCLARTFDRLEQLDLIATALHSLATRPPFLMGRCQCGSVGVRMRRDWSDNAR
jgi:hypothetical protein